MGWAGVLLAFPRRTTRAMGGPVDATSVSVARVLGLRHAVQGTAEIVIPTRRRWLGVALDLLHGSSAALLAALIPSWRRIGFTDAALATTFAVAGIIA